MAGTRTTATNTPANNNDHWNSGSLGQRALWALFEQSAHGAGGKVAKQLAKTLGDQVFAGFGGSENALFANGAKVAAQALLNADSFGKFLAGKLNIPADKVMELTNEGLDEFVRGVFDSAQAIDTSLPIDQQNAQLRQHADRQLEGYLKKVALQNPQMLREVIVVQDHGIDVVHEMGCSFERPRLDAKAPGVRQARWIDVPGSAIPAACACRRSVTFKGRLNDVLDYLRSNGVESTAKADRFMAELRSDACKDIRQQVLARASVYDQTTVGMVEGVLREPDPVMRRELILALVGITPKSASETAAAGAVTKGKQILKDLTDPNSKLRQRFDTGVAEYVKGSNARQNVMRGGFKPTKP